MGRGLAYRRHQAERAKAKVRRWVRDTWTLRVPDEAEIGIMAKSMPLCSCECCGNPRRHFGWRTLQERRQMMADEKKSGVFTPPAEDVEAATNGDGSFEEPTETYSDEDAAAQAFGWSLATPPSEYVTRSNTSEENLALAKKILASVALDSGEDVAAEGDEE